MHWVSSGTGLLSAFLLLRWSPFPRWAKLLLPFGAFLLFHAPIIARSYGLSILLMLVLAALYRSSRDNTLLACVVCGLLANTSLYAFAASIGFAVLFLGRAFRQMQRSALTGLLIVSACMVGAVQQTIPAPDAAFSFATPLNKIPAVRRTFSVLTGIPISEEAILEKKRKEDAGQVEAAQIAAAAVQGRSRNREVSGAGSRNRFTHRSSSSLHGPCWPACSMSPCYAGSLPTGRGLKPCRLSSCSWLPIC